MIGDFGVLGEGAERPSGGREWEGGYGRDFFKN